MFFEFSRKRKKLAIRTVLHLLFVKHSQLVSYISTARLKYLNFRKFQTVYIEKYFCIAVAKVRIAIAVYSLNSIKNILPLKTKKALYSSFILSYFYYCNQVWHHCGKINTLKLERVNERALRYIYKNKQTSYNKLIAKAGVTALENRIIQDI